MQKYAWYSGIYHVVIVWPDHQPRNKYTIEIRVKYANVLVD